MVSPLSVIIKGKVYGVNPYEPNPFRPSWLGFGGRHHVIEKLATGERLHTNNLIYAGAAAEGEPDTARFAHVGHSGSICQCPGFGEEKVGA